jgi:predicted nucleic acid-binding protein
MAWLLDTNVLSELRRPKPEARVVAFVSALPLGQLYIHHGLTVVTRDRSDYDKAHAFVINPWDTP